MNPGTMAAVRQRWRRLADPCATDRELLQRFTADRDEAAFAALVRRHGPLVRAAGRRVLNDAHAADDICQATFLVLAKKAASPHWHKSVANWLYTTARRLALKARTAAARRADRERQVVAQLPAEPLAEITGRELLAVLDEELHKLPERWRAPLLLCYWEGATRDEAARNLGCPPATIKKRLEQGRARLQAALDRRGLGLTPVLLGALLVRESSLAAADALARAAVVVAAGGSLADVVSPQVLHFFHEGLTMTGGKLVKGVAVLVFAVSLVASAGALLFAARDPQPAAQPPAAPRTLRVTVIDAQGKPLPGANVFANFLTYQKDFKTSRDYPTDAAGVAQVAVPATFTILRMWATKKSYAGMFAGWEEHELRTTRAFPTEYKFQLEAGVAATGRTVDEQGRPVAKANVQVRLEGEMKPAGGDGRAVYDGWLANGPDAERTDAEGRWRIDNVPNRPESRLSLLIAHPDFVSDEQWRPSLPAAQYTATVPAVVLKAGLFVQGRVTDPAGRPVRDALIITSEAPLHAQEPCQFRTDTDGRFRLPAFAKGPRTLTVIAAGWAPQLRRLNFPTDPLTQDFRLAPGRTIRVRIVDHTGKPVLGAYVTLNGWQGVQSLNNSGHPNFLETHIPQKSGADGVWEWTWAPAEPVKIGAYVIGVPTTEFEIAGGAPERTVTLYAEYRVRGRVTDAATGQPIPAFTVIRVDARSQGMHLAQRSSAVAGQDGRFDFRVERGFVPERQRLRVEAPGYRVQDGPAFLYGDDVARTHDFRLQPSPPLAGLVLDANGQPVTQAEVLLATPTDPAVLGQDGRYQHATRTDAAGRFTFPDPDEPAVVVARAAAGFALAEFPAGRLDVGTLRLQPWAAVRGQFRDGGRPVAGATVLFQLPRLHAPGRPYVETAFGATTDESGRYEFPRVPPGQASVHVLLGPWKDEGYRSGPNVPLDLKPGARADVNLGGSGATVTGRVKLTGAVPAGLDCTYSLNYLVKRESAAHLPPELAALGFDAKDGWRESWRKSAEGQTFLHALRHWFVKLAPDGSFQISGVPPGDYDLAIAVYAKPSGCLVDPLASQVVRVTVPAAGGEVKLPAITATVAPVPAVGDTPTLTFRRADGSAGTLTDQRGRFTLVQFWASWCGPCKQQLPALRQLHERFAPWGLATLGLSLDESEAAWQAALPRLKPAGPHGRLDAAGAAGVSSVPAYWLLDDVGKIVAKANHPDELAAVLETRLK